MMSRFLVTAGFSLVAGLSPTTAQVRLSFDVTSIKPSEPGIRQSIQIQPGGRFIANGISLGLLVAIAYHLRADQMIGANGWVMEDQWSIEAKTADGVVDPPSTTPAYMGVPEPMALRLQALLADRFALKTHRETLEKQVYALTIAKGGSKLRAVDSTTSAIRAGGGQIVSSAMSIDQLVGLLNRLMDAPVVDKTGLTAYYHVQLSFDPASTPRQLGVPTLSPSNPDSADAMAPSSTEPSIFTALQEQLGLKLESAKEPVEVLVIDSAQRPSPN